MSILRVKLAEAELLAETPLGVVIQLDGEWRKVAGRHRTVVVQVHGPLDPADVAWELRALADELDWNRTASAPAA